jgi:radical SAM protein with 4Fe4S-binding SPASM domain
VSAVDRLAAASMARGIPLSVQVDLTMRCNERCVHCYRVVESRPELSGDEVRTLLGELAAAGTLYLTFSGGEIFLRADAFDLIAHAKRLRFDVRLKSNALRVTAAGAARLRELGVRQVDVSVYSATPAVHDRVTRVEGSLARSIEGVRLLRAAGLRVRLNCPLMADTVGSYREVRALAERLGVDCGFDPMITARNDGDAAPLGLRVRGRALLPVLQDPVLNPGPEAGTEPDARWDAGGVLCGAGHSACYVSAYGDVMPCVAMPVACGNIREAPFLDIWREAAGMRRVRSLRVRDLHTCSGCEASPFCTRCPGQALVEDGDLLGPSSAACDHAVARAQVAGFTVTPASAPRPR